MRDKHVVDTPGAAPGGVTRTTTARGRPWPWVVHSVLGVHVSVLMAFVCLTGTVATLSHEIEWIVFPMTRAERVEVPASWGAQWDAARAVFPGATFSAIARKGSESKAETYLATVVSGTDRAGGDLHVYIRPADAAVQGYSRGTPFHSFMRGLHYYLFDPSSVMFYVVTTLGPLLLLLALTGMTLHRGWWRRLPLPPRRTARPRVWWGQVHRFTGSLAMPFALIIGVTGLWYLVEKADWVAWEGAYPALSAPMKPRAAPWTGDDIDRFVVIAEGALPGLEVVQIWLPWDAMTPIQVQGRRGDLLVRNRANRVAIDPDTDRVVAVQRADEMGARRRFVHTADPLHFGDFWGLPSKLLWALFGLVLTALAASGIVVHVRRLKDLAQRGTRPETARHTAPAHPPPRAATRAAARVGVDS